MHRLLAIWPELWRTFRTPLAIAYDLRGVLHRHGARMDPLGERLRAIEALVEQPGVIVLDSLDAEGMDRLRARSCALLYPLDPVIPHSELLSLAVLEACAAGCPAVLAPVDCFPAEYGSVARLVRADGPAYDAGSWIEAVGAVLADETATARARTFAAGRSWDRFADGFEGLLRDVVGRPAAHDRPRGQTWLALSVGEGHGEAAILRPVLEAAAARGHRLRVLTDRRENADLLDGPWQVEVATGMSKLAEAIAAAPDRIVLSSSALFRPLLGELQRLAADVPVVSLEFSWPWWLAGMPGAEHLQRLVIAMPADAWSLGLQLSSTMASVPPAILARARCAGFVASPAPVPRRTGAARRILLYFGGRSGWVAGLEGVLAETLATLRRERDTEARYVCGAEPIALPGWVQRIGAASYREFQELVAGADLVISSGGAGTTAAAAVAGTPHLALTPGLLFRSPAPEGGDFYSHVMLRCDHAEHIPGLLPASSYLRLARRLLEEGRREPADAGALHAVRLIETAERPRARPAWRPAELHP